MSGRVQAVVNRTAGQATDGASDAPHVVEAPELTEALLAEAGVREATALALVHDDETNIRTALAARRLNPKLFNRCVTLGSSRFGPR
jgi:Trk K+ transport system NAD-binding subunit